MRTLGMPLLALAAPALFAGACGKDDNAHPPSVVEFPHAFPEAPRALSARNAPAWTTGHGLAATDRWLYVTDRDNQALVRMDRATLTVEQTLPLGAKPEQVVVAPDGAVLVTLRGAGEVARIVDMKVTKRIDLGVESWGLALSTDGDTLYVTLPRERALVMLDPATLEELDRVDTLDEPRGVSFAPAMNGMPAFVTVIHQHTGPVQLQVDDDGLVDDQRAFDVALRIGNPADHLTQTRLHGLQATRALAGAVNPENGQVYVAHVVVAPGTEGDFRASEVAASAESPVPVSDGGYGSTAIPGASVNLPTRPVEVAVTASMLGGALAPEAEFPVQDPASGEDMLALVDQPSDLAHHPSHTLLFMTGYGTDNVLVMSTAESDPMRSPIGVISVGEAPRAIAFSPDGQLAYVLNEFDLSVSEIDLAPFLTMSTFANPGAVGGDLTNSPVPMAQGFADSAACPPDAGCRSGIFAGSDPTPMSERVNPIRVQARTAKAFGLDPLPAEIRRGARVFTFARNENLSHAGQFACASCHFEGREDKLVWFIPDGPRQTPSLAGRLLGTAPFNWNGSKDELKSNMEQTVSRMGGTGLTHQELDDLERFLLRGLEVPANPYLAKDGTLTPQQAEGKEIFESSEAACSSCHRPEQNFTDGMDHDVGTASQLEVARYEVQRATDPNAHEPGKLNTPTLKGLFYTAPYLHDGSAKDLYEALDLTATSMGHTAHLTKAQKDALVAYLLTL